jgi:very-short-patch-repair endonuclease
MIGKGKLIYGAMGYQILRFSNQAVINDIGDVISKISSALFEIWVAKIS